MGTYELIVLGIMGAAAWYAWDAMRAKELARNAGRQACARADVQFLDDSVVNAKWRLRRAPAGNLQICRRYLFEFTSDGEQRYNGYLTLCGTQVVELHMDPYRIDALEPP